jgi:hypothetical protein
MSRAAPAATDSLMMELWRTGVWRVLPILFLYVTSECPMRQLSGFDLYFLVMNMILRNAGNTAYLIRES